jgi:hypothetical protein
MPQLLQQQCHQVCRHRHRYPCQAAQLLQQLLQQPGCLLAQQRVQQQPATCYGSCWQVGLCTVPLQTPLLLQQQQQRA